MKHSITEKKTEKQLNQVKKEEHTDKEQTLERRQPQQPDIYRCRRRTGSIIAKQGRQIPRGHQDDITRMRKTNNENAKNRRRRRWSRRRSTSATQKQHAHSKKQHNIKNVKQ